MMKQIFLFLLLTFVGFAAPEGLSYRHLITDVPQSIHIFEIDPIRYMLQPVRALDECVGRENVLSLATRKGAVAAVNGGFFEIGGAHDGSPCGVLKIDQKWYGLPYKPRGAIGWHKEGQTVVFDRLLAHLDGLELHVDPQLEQADGCEWDEVDHIVGGAPLLIHRGEKITDFSAEKTIETFLSERHARTAVGVLANGNWVFLVVDGKQPGWSLGMTMDELAQWMGELGCIEALNLDGGGSSTCVYGGCVVNRPTGEPDPDNPNQRILRGVSDAILVLEKRKR